MFARRVVRGKDCCIVEFLVYIGEKLVVYISWRRLLVVLRTHCGE